MSAAAIAADPAVVSAKPTKTAAPHDVAPPKPEKPKSSALPARHVRGETGENTFPDVDFSTHVVVLTTMDGEYVSIPRASAKNIPGLVVPDAPAAPAEGEKAATPAVIEVPALHASALIALNQWIEKKGVSGAPTTAFANPVTHTDVAQLTTDEFEKEFSKNLLKSGEAIIGCINFAEKNNMKGLQQFAIVALSCALRGKTSHEMAVVMGHNEEAFTDADINAGRAAFPDVAALAKAVN